MRLYWRCFELITWELLPMLAAYHLLPITDFPRVIVSWYSPPMGSINTLAMKRWLRMSHGSWKMSLKAILLNTLLLSCFSVLLKRMVSCQNCVFHSFSLVLAGWMILTRSVHLVLEVMQFYMFVLKYSEAHSFQLPILHRHLIQTIMRRYSLEFVHNLVVCYTWSC